MTDKKISQLANITGAELADSDEFVVARASTSENFSVTKAELYGSLPPVSLSYDDLIASTKYTYTAGSIYSVSPGDTFKTIDSGYFAVAASGASDHHATTAGGVKLYEAGPHFSDRARMVAAHARRTVAAGTVWHDDLGQYRYLGDSTDEITGMTGWTVVIDYLKTGFRFPSRTSFEAARLPDVVDTWEVLHPAAPSADARWYEFQRANDIVVTIDPASDLDTGTDTITATAHGLYERAKVTYSDGGGTAMTGLTDGGTYYLVEVATNSFKVAATRDGTAIDITGAGAGAAHTFTWSGQAIESGNGVKGIPLGDPTPYHWGATRTQGLTAADSEADSLASFQMCLDWANGVKAFYGEIPLAGGYHRFSDTLHVYERGFFSGAGAKETLLHGNFTSGPIVRFYNSHSGYRDMGATGGATRRAAASDLSSPGVLFEGRDEAGTSDRNTHCGLHNFYNYGHPGSAVHVVGPAFTGSFTNPDILSCKGHGFSFDRGQATGRTNLITALISGVCEIAHGRVSSVSGHIVAAGSDTSAFSTPALRIVIDNIEGGGNATDASVRYANAAFFLRGANHDLKNCGISHANAMAFVAGRNIHLTNNRALDNDGGHAYTIGTYDELPTEDIYIDGINIISPTSPLDPAVLVTLPSGETTLPKGIHVNQTKNSQIATLVGTDSTMGSGNENRVPGLWVNGRVPLVMKAADQTVTNSTTFVDDNELTYYLAPNEEAIFHAVLQVDSDGSADFRARFDGPSGSTIEYSPPSGLKVDTTGSSVSVQSEVSGGTTMIFGSGGVGNQRYIEIRGRVVNGSTAGNLTLKWAQGTAHASDTIVKAGSHLSIERIEL